MQPQSRIIKSCGTGVNTGKVDRSGYRPGMRTAVVVLFLFVSPVAAVEQPAEDKTRVTEEWHLVSHSPELSLYRRARSGSALKEFKAIGTINAPTRVVHNVLNDVQGYPKFMPFVAECRVLKREGNSFYSYQRISPKIIGDRDYTLHIDERTWPEENGAVYSKKWKTANEFGPAARKGILRVKICDGSWLLEPETAETTRATYSVYTDTGGSLPSFLANIASEIGIQKVFTAVCRQVKDPKYRSNRDFLEPET